MFIYGGRNYNNGVVMAKLVLVTLPDEVHALLEKIKEEKGFANNAEALEWIIRRVAGVDD